MYTLVLLLVTGLLYDGMKDQYKVFSNGEKVESGSWSDNPHVSLEFSGPGLNIICSLWSLMV